MFKKLFDSVQSRFQDKTSDHPLGSEENLQATVAGIGDGDALRRLFEVDELLGGIEAAQAEIGVAATVRAIRVLDACCVDATSEVLDRYLTPGKRDHLSDALWSALDIHATRLFDAYRLALPTHALAETDDRAAPALYAARALRAWAVRKKLLRFRYRTPLPALWAAAHEVVMRASQLGLAQTRLRLREGDMETTPLREYLVGVYLELTPLGNLIPQQVEFAERLLRSGEVFDFAAQAGAASTHVIDLATSQGPRRREPEQSGGGALRFLATVRQRGALSKLAAQIKNGEVPGWLVALPLSREQIDATLIALALHWAPTPPQRSAARHQRDEAMLAVFGFGMARRLVAASHFARMGRSLDYDVVDFEKIYQEHRFGGQTTAAREAVAEVAKVAAPAVVNPLDILHRLELAGDKAQMEQWIQDDSSDSGFGAILPAILPRHRIGGLIAARYADGLEWRLGVVRRIGRDARNRPSIGIETLSWPSLCAMAKPVGEVSRWSEADNVGHGWIDAIIVTVDGNQLLLPQDTFVEALDVDVRSEEGIWRVRLMKLLDRGVDYDRIEFQRQPD